MKSVKFPGANIEMAKDQPEYNSIHMKAIEGPQAEVIACYEFSDEELALIIKTKRNLVFPPAVRFPEVHGQDTCDGSQPDAAIQNVASDRRRKPTDR